MTTPDPFRNYDDWKLHHPSEDEPDDDAPKCDHCGDLPAVREGACKACYTELYWDAMEAKADGERDERGWEDNDPGRYDDE